MAEVCHPHFLVTLLQVTTLGFAACSVGLKKLLHIIFISILRLTLMNKILRKNRKTFYLNQIRLGPRVGRLPVLAEVLNCIIVTILRRINYSKHPCQETLVIDTNL